MRNLFGQTSFVLYLFSGLLLGIGFVVPGLWIGGIVGIGLFICATKAAISKWQAAWGGFVSWTIKSLLAIFWFWSTYPIEWIDLSLGRAEVPVVGFYWFSVSCFLGLGGLLVSLIWWYLNKQSSIFWGVFIFPFIWLMGEVAGSFSFSLFTTGEGIGLNTIFSFGYQGYLLGNHELLILAAKWGGVYLLSLIAAFLGGLGYLIYQTFPKPKSYLILVLVVVVLVVTGYKFHTPVVENKFRAGETTVAIIDTRFGGDFVKEKDFEIEKKEFLKQAVEAALALNPDYIILPEDSRYTESFLSPEKAYRYFRFDSSDAETVLIDSGRTAITLETSTLRAIIYDGISKKGWATDKQYLVPQGEFMPYFYQNILGLLGMERAINEIQRKLDYRPGPLDSQAELPEIIPAILFCFEGADPYAVKRLFSERNPPFVAHPISHAWFHESKILWHHFDLMLKIQALWNNTKIVSAGNMVEGALYTQTGKKVKPETVVQGDFWKVSLVSW